MSHVLSFVLAVKRLCLDTLTLCETADVNWTEKQEKQKELKKKPL